MEPPLTSTPNRCLGPWRRAKTQSRPHVATRDLRASLEYSQELLDGLAGTLKQLASFPDELELWCQLTDALQQIESLWDDTRRLMAVLASSIPDAAIFGAEPEVVCSTAAERP